MNKIKLILATFLAFVAVVLVGRSSPILAAACEFALSGNVNISTSCNLPTDYYDGADVSGGNEASTTNTAVMTITNATLTISPGSDRTTTLMTGSLEIGTGGSLVVSSGSQFKFGAPIYVNDSDADGYVDDLLSSTKPYFDATASGRRRKSLMKSVSVADCDANSYSATNSCCVTTTYYRDADSDTYGNPNVTVATCPPTPAGYVADNTDCYDSNANAKPGQTNCYYSNRGDGSFDYNCSNTDDLCGGCSASYSTAAGNSNRTCVNDYCYTPPAPDTYFTSYSCSGSVTSCGSGGWSCWGTKYASCTTHPCYLSNPKNTGAGGCTVSCR